jgi:hypothetical protein
MGPRLWSKIIFNCSPHVVVDNRGSVPAPPRQQRRRGAPDEDRPVGISSWAGVGCYLLCVLPPK